jgi:two-component system, chemotaxis family, response regulator Rcp1
MGIASGLIVPFAADGPFPPPPSDPGGHPHAGTGPDRVSTQPNVLLVDDDASYVCVISRALNQCGIQIQLRVAADGEQALSILGQSETGGEHELPSLILLDWNLPGVSGAEVLAYARESRRLMNVPVLVVTSTDAPMDVREIARLGATARFRKPTNLDAYLELKTILLEALAKPPEPRS